MHAITPALGPEPKRRRWANRRIHALTLGQYFDSIPVAALKGILADHGFQADQLDGVYCGREGRVDLPTQVGERTWFTMSWYQMASGRYEVTCYLS